MDSNTTGYNKPIDLNIIASELNFAWDYGQLTPDQQNSFNEFMQLVLDSPTMNLFDANWQEIEYSDINGNLLDVELFNQTSPELVETSTNILMGNGYYDGGSGGGGGMYSDGFDYVFTDYHQGVGSDYCPANYDWIFYF